MHHLYVVRPVKRLPRPSDEHAAKVIELRVRRKARRAVWHAPRPDRPDAA